MALPHYFKAYGQLDPAIYQGLLVMSASTIDRLLASSRVKCGHGLSGIEPGKILKKHIPNKTDQWDEKIPGFLEAGILGFDSDNGNEFINWHPI